MKIPFNPIERQFYLHQNEYETKALEVLRGGYYILGSEVSSFENEFAAYTGSSYCLGLASGLDALVLAFRSLGVGEGDEVIVAANSYIACVMGITMNGAVPVFAEPDEHYNITAEAIESLINDKTKAVLAVHLYGQACDMKAISKLCKEKRLYLVEDCAQSHGASSYGQMTGTFGDVGCFSFYPSKNLGAFGDAGAIVTEDAKLYDKMKALRNYGSEKRYYNKYVGYNSRLDELQAGLLRVKLRYLDSLNSEREQIANRYLAEIDNPQIILPKMMKGSTSSWHLFVIRTADRDGLMQYLKECGIDTMIHYPIPPHLSEAYSYLGYSQGDFPLTERYSQQILSLPIYNGMTNEETDYVIEVINSFKKGQE